jgi:hypothetical protein
VGKHRTDPESHYVDFRKSMSSALFGVFLPSFDQIHEMQLPLE